MNIIVKSFIAGLILGVVLACSLIYINTSWRKLFKKDKL